MVEKQYKHKLNMLGSGAVMSKIITALFVIAVGLYFCNQKTWALIIGCISGIILFILLILLAVEQHQDRVLNEQQIQSEKEKETHNK